MHPSSPVDRRALVRRHTVEQTTLDPRSPVTVGNGEFAVTVDLTGLQSLPAEYPVHKRGHEPDREVPGTLLGTQSQWAWHSIAGEREYSLEETTRRYEVDGRLVPYVEESRRGTPGYDANRWFRANPHRLDLGRIGFVATPVHGADGDEGDDDGDGLVALRPTDLTDTRQVLDLWTGTVDSSFSHRGAPVQVRTAVHPTRDRVGVTVRSALAAGLAIAVDFPYGSSDWHNAADWDSPDAHSTTVTAAPGGWLVERRLDDSAYRVHVAATGAELSHVEPHRVVLRPTSDVVDAVLEFTTDGRGDMVLLPGRAGHEDTAPEAGDAQEVLRASGEHWQRFWESGAAVQLAGSADPRASELERRVVLSQYVTAVNCAGSLPPQETGLVCNSWRGKFHLEMHWWHAAHFPMWGRPELLRPSLGWYRHALPLARATAQDQGYAGARWPKQLGSVLRETPSSIGVHLVWQQPHVVYMSELVHRVTGDDAFLREQAEVVFASAEFMAAFAQEGPDGFTLGPPLVPAQESYAGVRDRMSNPPFELAYWRWALRTANAWRERLGLPVQERWAEVAEGMVAPHVRDGVYTGVDVEPYTIRADHPSVLGALGIVPDVGLVDPAVMRATYQDVLRDWDWGSTWGWDYPMMAMTATRLGEPGWAVDALMDTTGKNVVLPNGHNHQTESLPLYLPGNGGLLSAVALMARTHLDGGAGFPSDWDVQLEGFPATV
ncbi:hypothetical protein [Krasilnikoviella flava]|uniref:Glycosyl hydrolase family 65, N-terminal domain n=1 Tax=Krasilnikoviella flava TaxID=526729 RepID=A0A1T5K7A6_9MICO|nr:hypothetical protein [Krasilnikoviella flava]SKC59500.1 hypothetical protein SAMN04324258_1898 [Krasilnikoviella flava]